VLIENIFSVFYSVQIYITLLYRDGVVCTVKEITSIFFLIWDC